MDYVEVFVVSLGWALGLSIVLRFFRLAPWIIDLVPCFPRLDPRVMFLFIVSLDGSLDLFF